MVQTMAISFDDFAKLDLRIGTVKSVEKVPHATKLLRFVFDIGQSEERQIMAGMAEFVSDPSGLVGAQFPLLLNIEPRRFRGYESHGMIIAADHDEQPVFLRPERSVPSGSKVK
jgi:methionine--tRNA ligase beta chain